MAELKLVNISVFVILTFPFAAAGSYTKLSVKVGDEITLLCQNAKDFHDRCSSTTWIFGGSGSRTVVTLFEYGQIHSDARAQSHRLSVTANCSLVIKKVTSLDQGLYNCRQFVSGQQVSDFMVDLSVIKTTGTPPSNSTSIVTTVHFPGKDTINATTTTAKPKSTGPTSTPTPAQTPTTAAIIKSPPATITAKSTTTRTKSDMTTTIIKSITTTTNVASLMTKTTTMTIIKTKTIAPDTITTTNSNTTIITIKSPTKTFNSTTTTTTTTTTIRPARSAEECLNTVQSKTMLIIVAVGFATLFIMMAVMMWQISKWNKTQMSGNIERSTNRSLGPRTNLERVHSEHNQRNAVTSSSATVSHTSSGASTDGSSIYATMRRI